MPESPSRRLPPCRRSSIRPAAQRARGHRWPTDRFRLPGQARGIGEADNTANASTARTRLNGHPPAPRASAHGEPVQPANMETDLHGAQDYHKAHALASKASGFFSPAGPPRRATAGPRRRGPCRGRRGGTGRGARARTRRRAAAALRRPGTDGRATALRPRGAAGGAVVAAAHESCLPCGSCGSTGCFGPSGPPLQARPPFFSRRRARPGPEAEPESGTPAAAGHPGRRRRRAWRANRRLPAPPGAHRTRGGPSRATARPPGRADATPRPPGPRRRRRSRPST